MAQAQVDTQFTPSPESLFVRIGGADAVKTATEKFYERMLADERVNRFFAETVWAPFGLLHEFWCIRVCQDMVKQKAHFGRFLTFAFGGTNKYNGRSMREAHKKPVSQGMNETHFDAVMENLAATLNDLGVPDDLIDEAAAIALSTKKDVLNL